MTDKCRIAVMKNSAAAVFKLLLHVRCWEVCMYDNIPLPITLTTRKAVRDLGESGFWLDRFWFGLVQEIDSLSEKSSNLWSIYSTATTQIPNGIPSLWGAEACIVVGGEPSTSFYIQLYFNLPLKMLDLTRWKPWQYVLLFSILFNIHRFVFALQSIYGFRHAKDSLLSDYKLMPHVQYFRSAVTPLCCPLNE